MGNTMTSLAIRRPKLMFGIALLLTALSLLKIMSIRVDTDPENMLDETEWVRVFHNEVKADFQLSDMVVLGVVNEAHDQGVFNKETLGKVYRIAESAADIEGVVTRDLMAPSRIDDILQAGLGAVTFKYLMEAPPTSEEEALHLRERIMANPLLHGTLVSEDGKALAIYVPIEKKDIAHRVSLELRELIEAEPHGSEHYHITGLPVAEDTFGIQMFEQMALSAPLAGLLVLLLMFYFFRKLSLVISPMVVAMLTVAITMGTLISLGFTVHIMSSMIPIFLMPIAVVDSVHILSVFFDRYQVFKDREETLVDVMKELFVPMLYTSITTMAGFGSLALTPIPPVQVFGVFVAFGVFMAWLLTVTLIPAYIMLFIKDEKLENFGSVSHEEEEGHTFMARMLMSLGGSVHQRAKMWLTGTLVLIGVSAYGISLIQINDNPVKWFTEDHPIRVADTVLNEHFGGTYEAYLVLEPEEGGGALDRAQGEIKSLFDEELTAGETAEFKTFINHLRAELPALKAVAAESGGGDPEAFVNSVAELVESRIEELPDSAEAAADELYAVSDGLEELRVGLHFFKDPEVLRYVTGLQKHLAASEVVGKSNSLADLVKKVHMELFEGKSEADRIPDTAAAVAQCILSFQGSHDPDDVWHLVTPDYRRLNLWVQLKSGDNKDMEEVVAYVERYFEENPPPAKLKRDWAGLTYLNVVWQDKMVSGMLDSLLGSFAVVLVLMSLLFRSLLWGILSMIPLSVTIAFIYGLIGLMGKDYDMPVAVLSSLTLGMSVDFAIHYIERAREVRRETSSWTEAVKIMSAAPARAITRNGIVISMGFLPLLMAGLIPYRTVGFFLFTIMAVSGLSTLVILPALITVFQKLLFKKEASSG